MNTQSVSQNGWLLRAVGLASAIMLTLQVSAENWIAATGSFTDGANWNNGTAPTNGAWAVIDNGGTALMDGGSVTCTFLYPGYTATGHLIQSGGDISVTGNSDPTFGLGVLEGSDGTYDVSGGSLSQLAGNFQVGGRGTGTFTQSGGVVTGNNWVVVGRYGPAGNGTLTVSGGTFLQNSSGNALIIAEGGTGSLTVTNTGVVNINGSLRIGMVKNGVGDMGTGTGTVYLCRGGTISTPIVNTLGGSSTFYFDGGVLCARGSWQTYGAFMQGLSAAYVRPGGAVIDTGSNAATINQNLLNGGGAGGLTKLGSGVLALGGANAYAGNTVVSNGVLAALTASALPGYDTAGRVKVADGAGLSVGVGGSSAWTETQAYTLAATASFGSNGSFGFDTSLGNATLGALPDLGSLSLVKTGVNVLQLTGNNTYSGNATVYGGVLQADFGTGLSASGNVTLMGGTLSSAGGSITAASGSGAGQINIASNAPAGFSAYGAPLNVNLGGAGASLQWGTASFNPNPLLLNETGANAALTFANGLDLAGGARTITVNSTTAGAGATVSGAVTDSVGGGGLTKNGAGSLTLSGTGSCTGFTYVNDGALNLTSAGGYSLGEITVTGGGLNVGAAAVTQTTGNFVVHNGAASLEGGSVSDANGQGYIGMWWGTSLLSVNGGSFSVGNELNVGTWAGSTGAINLSGGTVSCATLYVGRGGNGTFTQTGGSVVRNNNPSGEWRIGGWEDWSTVAGTGVYNMQGGTLDTVGQNLQIGCSGRGTMNQTGGTVTCGGWPVVGRFYGGTGVYNLSGGTFNQTSSDTKMLIAEHGTATWTVKGSGVANLTGGLSICSGGGTGYVNLEQGGTINTPTVTTFDGSRPSTLNFDGGILRANGSSPVLSSFVSGLTTASIKEGGALIDSNGKTLTVAQNLTGASSVSLLRHRWSFNGNLSDSVGGQTATMTGAVTSDGKQVTLSGGVNGTSFISLGTNILPSDSSSPVTIELWATQHAIQNWSRIFDFGYGQGDYILMAWTFGTDVNHDHVELKTGNTPNSLQYTMSPYTLDTEFHIAMVLTPGAGEGGKMLAQWYKMDASGATLKSGSMSLNFSLANLPQINMWLGRSEYSGDNDASASYNEVRIWNAALSEDQLRENSVYGPDGLLHDGGVTKLGDGTLILTGSNSYTGPTTVSNGVLRVGSANAVPVSNDVCVAGGTYDLGGFTVTNGAVTLASGSLLDGTLVASAFNLTDSGTVYASLAGQGTLTKSGTGTVSLAGSSTYTGETLIEGGTLATALPTSALLRHRWSFNGNLSDSVAGQTAMAVGAVNPGSTQYTLAGNGDYGSSYIDLGANILPSDAVTPVTIELWATENAYQTWARIFDFGFGQQNYLIMAWYCNDGSEQFPSWVEAMCGGSNAVANEKPRTYELNKEYHIAFELIPGAGTGGVVLVKWYVFDGTTLVKAGSMNAASNFSLASLPQNNMWLGHSEYTADKDGNASYNEVRIWNAALTEAQLQANSVLGPDALQTTFSSGAALPNNASVTISAGAALNLVGATQTVASVSGSGAVSNGTLNVTDTIAPGGVGTIGTLTLAAETSLAGTLLVDVATDGTSDLLQSPGALNLSGLTLTVQDPDQLAKGKEYTIVKAAPGALSGRFAATSLDTGKWQVIYRYSTGEVKIILRQGLTVIVR